VTIFVVNFFSDQKKIESEKYSHDVSTAIKTFSKLFKNFFEAEKLCDHFYGQLFFKSVSFPKNF
jgi:hypothetical protein